MVANVVMRADIGSAEEYHSSVDASRQDGAGGDQNLSPVVESLQGQAGAMVVQFRSEGTVRIEGELRELDSEGGISFLGDRVRLESLRQVSKAVPSHVVV